MSIQSSPDNITPLVFKKQTLSAKLISPSGETVEQVIEVRTNPITERTGRITFSRAGQTEPDTDALPLPPPNAGDTASCPFCRPRVFTVTPQIVPNLVPSGRLVRGESILFPNLFPYGNYSAVCVIDNNHFTEIGTASIASYTNSFLTCAQYLQHVTNHDSSAIYLAVTQNHLPSAGGSLVHPHLQVHADSMASNHQRFLRQRAASYFQATGVEIFSDYLRHEKEDGTRYIGQTGRWEWVAAFAPEGFFEIWGILPYTTSLRQMTDLAWESLAAGVVNTQRFYRSLKRNGYNLGLLMIEDESSRLELRVVTVVRANYSPWSRNDHTGFEVMLGDMATFTTPEDTAKLARPFW